MIKIEKTWYLNIYLTNSYFINWRNTSLDEIILCFNKLIQEYSKFDKVS